MTTYKALTWWTLRVEFTDGTDRAVTYNVVATITATLTVIAAGLDRLHRKFPDTTSKTVVGLRLAKG